MRRTAYFFVPFLATVGILSGCGEDLSTATEHADLLAQVETLQLQLSRSTATNAEVEELRVQVGALQSELSEATTVNTGDEELQVQVNSLTSQLAKAKADLRKAESQNSELESMVGDLEASLAATEDVPSTTTTPPPTTTILAVEIEVEVSDPEVELILTAAYSWGPSSTAEALQTVLGVVADGWYGNQTRLAHLAELEARGLSTDAVPTPPTTTVAVVTTTTVVEPDETATVEETE